MNATDGFNFIVINGAATTVNTTLLSTNQSATRDNYDKIGAMHFIIATVLTYSVFGVFCILLDSVKRIPGTYHGSFHHDESIRRYLKREEELKIEGMKMKMQHECRLVSQKIRLLEEKQNLLEIERDLASDFTIDQETSNKKGRKAKRTIGNMVGKIGFSLIYMGDTMQEANESCDLDNTSLKSDRDSVKEINEADDSVTFNNEFQSDDYESESNPRIPMSAQLLDIKSEDENENVVLYIDSSK